MLSDDDMMYLLSMQVHGIFKILDPEVFSITQRIPEYFTHSLMLTLSHIHTFTNIVSKLDMHSHSSYTIFPSIPKYQ